MILNTVIFMSLGALCVIIKFKAVEGNSEGAVDLKAFDYDLILPNGAVKKMSFFGPKADEPDEQIKFLDNRIIGGKEVGLSEAPYQVGIMKKNTGIYCSGALYNENTVITAAHCYISNGKVDTEKGKAEFIYVVGKSNLLQVEKCSEVLRKASHIAIHPDFVPSPPKDQINDIAIVRLDRPICLNMTDNIKTIPIMSPNHILPNEGLVSGWGYTAKRTGKGDPRLDPKNYSRLLKQTKLIIYDKSYCKQKFANTDAASLSSHISYICAGVRDGESDACQGDSGGPLVCDVNGTLHLCGIVSIGIGCGMPDRPAFYSDVAYFNSWIQEVTKLSDKDLQNRYNNIGCNMNRLTHFLVFVWIIISICI